MLPIPGRPARRLAPALVAGLFLVPADVRATPDAVARAFEPTLEEALDTAFDAHPAIALAEAEVAATRGRWLASRVYPHNPELELEAGERRGAGETSTDRGVSLSQEIELAGQRRKRRAEARAALAAAEARLERRLERLAAEVEIAFAEALGARDLLALEEADAALAGEFLSIARRRFDAGAATQIDLNLALATAGRAERRVALARAAAEAAGARLSTAVGLDPVPPARPRGSLRLDDAEPPPLEAFLAAAARRSDLAALDHDREAAAARLRLERAEVRPNLRLAAFYEREEGVDDILGGGVAISLPIFDRNQGAIAEAAAEVDAARAEAELAVRAAREEVLAAWAAARAARQAAERLRGDVIGTLEENLELLQRSFGAGKVGAAELLLFRRELVEARREWIEARVESWRARIALDLASGLLSVPARRAAATAAEVAP